MAESSLPWWQAARLTLLRTGSQNREKNGPLKQIDDRMGILELEPSCGQFAAGAAKDSENGKGAHSGARA